MKIIVIFILSLSALKAHANWYEGMPVLTNCSQDDEAVLRLANIMSIRIDSVTKQISIKVRFVEKWSQILCADNEFTLADGLNRIVPYLSSEGAPYMGINIGDIVRVPYLKAKGKRRVVDISLLAGGEYVGVNIGNKKNPDLMQQFLVDHFSPTLYFSVDDVEQL